MYRRQREKQKESEKEGDREKKFKRSNSLKRRFIEAEMVDNGKRHKTIFALSWYVCALPRAVQNAP